MTRNPEALGRPYKAVRSRGMCHMGEARFDFLWPLYGLAKPSDLTNEPRATLMTLGEKAFMPPRAFPGPAKAMPRNHGGSDD